MQVFYSKTVWLGYIYRSVMLNIVLVVLTWGNNRKSSLKPLSDSRCHALWAECYSDPLTWYIYVHILLTGCLISMRPWLFLYRCINLSYSGFWPGPPFKIYCLVMVKSTTGARRSVQDLICIMDRGNPTSRYFLSVMAPFLSNGNKII